MRSIVNKTKITDKCPIRTASRACKHLYSNHLSLSFFKKNYYATRLFGLRSSSSRYSSQRFPHKSSSKLTSLTTLFLIVKENNEIIISRTASVPTMSPSSNWSSILPQSRILLCQNWWMVLFVVALPILTLSINTNTCGKAEFLINNISSTQKSFFRFDLSLLKFLLY